MVFYSIRTVSELLGKFVFAGSRSVLLQSVGTGTYGGGKVEKEYYSHMEEENTAISAVFNSGDGVDAVSVRKSGSYTIETAFVMAVVLWTLMIIISQAYNIHDKTRSGMVIHQNVEILCHQEENKKAKAEAGAKRQLSSLFSLKDVKCSFFVEKKKTEGRIEAEKWRKSIISDRFEPEAFLRMAALGQEWGMEDEY